MRLWIIVTIALTLTASCSEPDETSGESDATPVVIFAEDGRPSVAPSDGKLATAYRGAIHHELEDARGSIIERWEYPRAYVEVEVDSFGNGTFEEFWEGDPLYFDPSDPEVPRQILWVDEEESYEVVSGRWVLAGRSLSVDVEILIRDESEPEYDNAVERVRFVGEADERGRFPIEPGLPGGVLDGDEVAFGGGFAEHDPVSDTLHIELHSSTGGCDPTAYTESQSFVVIEAAAARLDRETSDREVRVATAYRTGIGKTGMTNWNGRVVIERITDSAVVGAVVIDDSEVFVSGRFEVPLCHGMEEFLTDGWEW